MTTEDSIPTGSFCLFLSSKGNERTMTLNLFLWHQAHTCTRRDFEKMYPEFPKFCAIREKLDPRGMFLNAYLEKVFY